MNTDRATLGGAVDTALKRFAEYPALSSSQGTRTYARVDAAAAQLASAYRALGVGRGDRVLCHLSNRPELLIAALAAWRRGAIHVGADKDLTAPELGQLVQHLTPALLITEGAENHATADRVAAARDAHPRVHVATCNEDAHVPGCHSWSDLDTLAGADEHPAATGLDPNDPAVILLTSGTTGTPKGVIRYHGQLLDHWTKTATLLRASPGDRHLAQLPLSHGFGFGLAIAGLLTGGSLILVERFSPQDTIPIVGNERITVLNGTPIHFRLLLDCLDPTRHDVSSLRVGAGSGARFPPQLLQAIFDQLGMDFVHTYGCSEGLSWKTTDKDEMLRGSIGRPPSDRFQVVGPDGASLPPGEAGDIVARKTHPVHYWPSLEPAVDSASDPNWHYMGDRGVTDESGHLYVLGRAHHHINRGGLKVDPGEVETALWAYPTLADAAVVGVPDPVQGELVCACIVPQAGTKPSLQEIREFLSGSLARHKLPERLCELERIPRTRLGKVDRARLHSLSAGE